MKVTMMRKELLMQFFLYEMYNIHSQPNKCSTSMHLWLCILNCPCYDMYQRLKVVGNMTSPKKFTRGGGLFHITGSQFLFHHSKTKRPFRWYLFSSKKKKHVEGNFEAFVEIVIKYPINTFNIWYGIVCLKIYKL